MKMELYSEKELGKGRERDKGLEVMRKNILKWPMYLWQ